MRIELNRSGGFANITRNVSIDTRDLPRETAQELADLINRINLPGLAGRSPIRRAGADRFQYDLTVTPDDREPYRVSIQEGDLTPELRSLIERMLAMKTRR